MIKGTKFFIPESSKLPKRPPVSYRILEILRDNLKLSDPEDSCVYACATLYMDKRWTSAT